MIRRHLRRPLRENKIEFIYDNLNEILHNLDAKKCQAALDEIVYQLNVTFNTDNFDRTYIEPEVADMFIIKRIKSEKIGIEKKLYNGMISWDVKIPNPTSNFDEEVAEQAVDDLNDKLFNTGGTVVELAGRSNGHLVVSRGQDIFQINSFFENKPVDAFLKIFDGFEIFNETYIEDIMDDYNNIYDMIENEICKSIRNDEYSASGTLNVMLNFDVFDLSDDFIKDLKLIDKEVKKFHNRYSE